MWVNWKRFTFGALLLASLSLLLLGCGDHSGSQTAQKAISGVVSDPATGLALPDATVTAYAIDANGVQATVPLSTPATVQSNNKGRYRLFIPAGYNGSVMVVASKSSSLGKLAKLLSLPASNVLIKAAVPQSLINRVSVPPVMVSFATNMVVQYLASTNASALPLTSDNIRKANIVLETFFGPNFAQVPPPASSSDSATSKAQQDLMVSIQAVNSVTQGSDAVVTAIVVALSADAGLGTKADDIKAAISATVTALTAQGLLPSEYVPSPAINTAISNAQSAKVSAPVLSDSTAPAPPTALALVAAAPKNVSLSWTAPADSDLAGYLVYRADATGIFVLAGGAPAGATGYVDATVAAGSAYSYQVAAFDASRNISVMSNQIAASTPAATDNVAPSVPAGLIAKGFDDVQVRLEWLASQKTLADGSNIPAVRYNVYRDFQLVGSSTGTSFSELGLTPGTSYLYFVKAVDANGNLSAASASVVVRTLAASGIPAPQPPTGLVLAAGSSYFSNPLSWTASTSTGTVTYNIYRDSVLIASDITGTSYHDNAVSPSSDYLYTVTAMANHAESTGATLSVTTPANPNLTDVDPPSKPTNLIVVSASSSAVALSWAPSSKLTGDQVVSGYDVLRSTGGSGSFVKVATVTRPTYVDTNNLSPSTTYSYAVKAFGSAGVRSDASLSATVTTPAPIDLADSTAPSAPGDLATTQVTGQIVSLAWSASTKANADATHFVAGYRVFRDGAQIADVHDVRAFSDLAVAPVTSYRYSVVAYDNSGNLSPASELTVTTLTSAANVYLVSGRVAINGVGISGITISNGTAQAVTDVNGNYTILGVAAGSYTVAPVANTATAFLAFTPVSRSVTVTSANVVGQDFAGVITGSLAGGVIFPGGTVVGGVSYSDGTIIGSLLYPTGAAGVTVTYGSGGLSGAVVYYFPISGTITDNAANPLANAVVTLVNNSNNQVTTYQATSDSLGHYVIHAPAGTYKVRATLASFTFADSAPVTVSNTVQSQTVTVAAN